MAEEVKQDRYQQEAIGENDLLAAFLALKSVTGTHNTPNLRKLGSIIGRSEGMLSPYRGKKFTLIDYFSTLLQVNVSFNVKCTRLNCRIFLPLIININIKC